MTRWLNKKNRKVSGFSCSPFLVLTENPSSRYGDYAHLTVDPADGITFWHNAEYFKGENRINHIGVFRLASELINDVGITEIVSPIEETLGANEEITVKIRNFGIGTQKDIPLSYSINGQTVTEIYTESIEGSSYANFTFSKAANLSEIGRSYEIKVRANVTGDQDPSNDTISRVIRNLPPSDMGVTSINSPETSDMLGRNEEISITVENFGGKPQSNIPVWYQIGNNNRVEESFPGTIEVGAYEVYNFKQTANLSVNGRYKLTSGTNLQDDFEPSNDVEQVSIASLDCIPEGSDCYFGDGISYFQLGDILNERIPCNKGYGDFVSYSTNLDRSQDTYTLTVETYFQSEDDEEKFSMWIDLDDNGEFDDDERLITSKSLTRANTSFSFDFSIPDDAPLGQHLLRIRAGDTRYEGDLNNPCDIMEFGTTHDYSVNIIDSDLDIKDFILNDAELKILDENSGRYRIVLETSFNESLRITVHNMLGQKLLENKVENKGDAYIYDLDMSYAAKGVYLVRIGTRKVGKVKRFIVK